MGSLWFKRQLIQLLQIIITIWIYGKEIYFDMLLTFGIHVSADTHLYSRLVIILPTYFWTSTLLYNVSAEANCFLRFIVIKFLIVLVTLILRTSFCWSWTEGWSTSAHLWMQWMGWVNSNSNEVKWKMKHPSDIGLTMVWTRVL